MKIKGIDGMTVADLQREIHLGGKFVFFKFCISILIMSFQRTSDIYFIPAEEKAWVKGLPYSAISLFLGWWGFPWGLIYTPISLVTNLSGGKDVTEEVLSQLFTPNQNFQDVTMQK